MNQTEIVEAFNKAILDLDVSGARDLVSRMNHVVVGDDFKIDAYRQVVEVAKKTGNWSAMREAAIFCRFPFSRED